MLLLLFNLGPQLYALDSSEVIEIIPMVTLRPLFHVPEYVAGLFNYRSKFIPVIDLAALLQSTPSRPCLSTRIIIINYARESGTQQYLGLMAEKITDTLQKSAQYLAQLTAQPQSQTHLGEIIVHEQQMIQLIRVQNLFPQAETKWLLSSLNGE
jgi:chemotaxis-related protein WspB